MSAEKIHYFVGFFFIFCKKKSCTLLKRVNRYKDARMHTVKNEIFGFRGFQNALIHQNLHFENSTPTLLKSVHS